MASVEGVASAQAVFWGVIGGVASAQAAFGEVIGGVASAQAAFGEVIGGVQASTQDAIAAEDATNVEKLSSAARKPPW